MRKRIEELAEGKIECVGPAIEFSVSRIEIEVLEGKDFTGEFTAVSKNQVSIRGLAYSTNPRMECLTEGFDGEEVTVRYKFHSAGLAEGDMQEGEFFVICSQGEYRLSFAVSVIRFYARSQIGTVQNLSDFAKLAKEHWQEAKRLFYSPAFLNLLKDCTPKERFLHIGLARGAKTDRSLEEFLLTAGLKKQITIKAEQTDYVFSKVAARFWQDIVLSKNTWGYTEVYAASDADFLVLQKNKITSEDFLGSKANFGFYIDPQKMHAGKNFACLTLKTIYQEISISVCAAAEADGGEGQKEKRKIRKLQKDLMQNYIDYRLGKIVTGRWAALSCRILDGLLSLEEGNVWYRLFKAQILWMNGQRQDAEWILNEFKRKCRDRKSPQWGYYLYICTLTDHEELYVNRLTEEIEQIYLEHHKHSVLFWCLLFLKNEYVQNGYQKLKVLEKKIMGGAKSPILYVEVYLLFCQEPYLIKRLGDFEIRILNWARRQGVLTKTLADQMICVFPEKMPYRKIVFLLLKECSNLMEQAKTILYERPGENTLTDEKRILAVICGYFIRNQKYGGEYFPWYEKGVAEKLRITGLYEAYLLSMDARDVLEVPKIIQMYFKYNNQLGSRQKAILYVNLIAGKERQSEAFLQNYPAMEKFAYEQMEKGNIDDNLAVIYKEVLSHGIYSRQVSDALSDVLFVHRLTCSWPQAARVVVLQGQTQTPQAVPFVNQAAYFSLYSNDYMIFIEDRQGNRYGGSIDYQLEKLMYPGRYLRICMQSSPGKLPYLWYYFAERKAQEVFEEKDLEYFLAVMSDEETDWAYKAWLFPKMFGLMHELGRAEEMEEALSQVDLSLMEKENRNRVLALCLAQKLYGQVYRIAGEYGFGEIEPAKIVAFLSSRIQKTDFVKDDRLLLFCIKIFLDGKFNDVMLKYLALYYKGPTEIMAEIFRQADRFGIETRELSERILVQMLYTDGFCDCANDVYKSFENGGNHRIKKAYLTFFAHRSFLRKGQMPKGFFEVLRRWYLDQNDMNEILNLALLRFYAAQPALGKEDKERMEQLLQNCLFQGMYFKFYKELGREFMVKYQLDDKYFIEHRTKKNSRVWLHYSLASEKNKEEAYITEEMAEVYEGVFVKKMILFAGESVRFSISEEVDGQMETVKSGTIACSFFTGSEKKERMCQSRYERLNEMCSLQAENDRAKLHTRMAEYRQLDDAVETMFSML